MYLHSLKQNLMIWKSNSSDSFKHIIPKVRYKHNQQQEKDEQESCATRNLRNLLFAKVKFYIFIFLICLISF